MSSVRYTSSLSLSTNVGFCQSTTERERNASAKNNNCLYCRVGYAGIKLTPLMVKARKMGLRRIVSVGLMRNWVRYSFLAVLCLLLFGGVLTTYFLEIDHDFSKHLRMALLGSALLINVLERLFYWYKHFVSKLDDKGSWNFCSDLIRPFATEIFVSIALLVTLFTQTEQVESSAYIFDLDRNLTETNTYFTTSGVSMIVFLAVLFILTAFVMRNYVVFSVSWSLLKKKVVNNSEAAFSQKLFFYGLRIHTIAQSVLQALLISFTGLLLYFDEYPRGEPFRFLAAVVIVPMASWFLYFATALPYIQLFPISMLVDLPPVGNQRNEINIQEVSLQFRVMHRHSMTFKGVCVNLLRLFAHPVQFILHILFSVAGGYTLYFLIYASFITSHSSVVVVGCVTSCVLLIFSLPTFLYGLLMSAFLPILLPMHIILFCVKCDHGSSEPNTGRGGGGGPL